MTDGAANLFEVGDKEPGHRFKQFLLKNYPWQEDPPFGLQPEDAVDLFWEIVRTPAVHRLGLQPNPLLFETRYVVLFSPTNESLSALERSTTRPFSEPTIKFDGTKLTVLLEGWYWGLRQAIRNAVTTKEKVEAIATHISSGKFARTNSLYKLLKAVAAR